MPGRVGWQCTLCFLQQVASDLIAGGRGKKPQQPPWSKDGNVAWLSADTLPLLESPTVRSSAAPWRPKPTLKAADVLVPQG